MALYYNVMKVDPSNPHWEQRDRFVLERACVPGALYAVLADKGFFPREELWTLRKTASHLQGHPDMRKTAGVDVNTGSLGQGVFPLPAALPWRPNTKGKTTVCLPCGRWRDTGGHCGKRQ